MLIFLAGLVRGMKVASYGSWKSPLTAKKVVEGGVVGLSGATPRGSAIYWLESRPSEGGRNVVMRHVGGKTEEAIPSDKNARTRVHEYGGGAWLAKDETTVIYSDFKTQRLFVNDEPLTAEPPTPAAWRYADACLRGDDLFCVFEQHDDAVSNSVAKVSTVDGATTVVSSGWDFYAAPRVSPDGTKLAFVRWNHPNMPWDATELVVRDLESGDETVVVGVDKDESVMQPHWNPATGDLAYLSDRSGWYALYAWDGAVSTELAKVDADLGDSAPGWRLGQRGYDFDKDGRLVATYADRDANRCKVLGCDAVEKQLPAGVSEVRLADDGHLVFLGSSPDAAPFVGRLNLESAALETLAVGAKEKVLPAESISEAEFVAVETTGGATAYAQVYLPKNCDFEAPAGEKPPLLVKAHGGPTACARAGYSAGIQFWTSRGFVVADVDYRGSTGYGREYRRALRGNWGVHDIDDVCAVAAALCERGLVDPTKLAIDGGSAGGYTTLGALAWKDTFTAGCSLYGVADLAVLARDTHKFESRYLDGLIGKWPEEEQVYKDRAPIESVDKLNCPVLLLQGDEDKIVPPNQAVLMHEALKAKNVPTALKIYEGEQHGFRKADNIVDALNSELFFFSRVFKFPLPPDEDIAPFPIDNLDD